MGGRGMVRAVIQAAAVFAVAVPGLPAVQDNRPDPDEEERLLRDAAAVEAAGDYRAADEFLRAVLRSNPTSLRAILSFARITALRGRPADVLPVLDSLIALEPRSVIGHQLRVRTRSVLNDREGLEAAAETWIAATPAIEVPYREIARVWRSRGDLDRAVEVLERGRSSVGRDDALALELGDAYAAAGDWPRVTAAWSRAIGPRGEAFLLVRRRLAGLADAGATVIPGLIDALVSEPTSPARTRAAVQLAVDAGLDRRAQAISADLLRELEDGERLPFMVELGRRADGAGLKRLALWAYGRIVSESERGERLLPVRSRIAELALAVGDTATAARTYRAMEGDLAPGSPDRRQAISLRVRMLAREGAFDSAGVALARLTAEPGSGPEADVAGAALANALIDAGRPEAAEEVVAGLTGPHAGFARGRVYMARGDIDRARAEILTSAPRLTGAEATEAIGLAALLARLSGDGGTLMSRGLAALAAGDRRDGVMLLYDGSTGLAERERAAILEFTAGVADRIELTAEAEQIRRDIIELAPHTPEAPVALLTLARDRLEHRQIDEARLLLERLVVEYPRSALVPQARHELERLPAQEPES